MVKTSKRTKKFAAKGGIEALKKKGSHARRGQKKNKKVNGGVRPEDNEQQIKIDKRAQQERDLEKERTENDFIGTKESLAQLDIDSFFKAAVESDDECEDIIDDDKNETDAHDESYDDMKSLSSDEEDVLVSEARLKKQLDELAVKDPDFHEYLKQNESSLLQFAEDEEEDYEESHDTIEMNSEIIDMEKSLPETISDQMSSKTLKERDKLLLTPQRLELLEQNAFSSHSLTGLKRIISAYKTACHLTDATAQKSDQVSNENLRHFHISSPLVFDRLIAVCLTKCYEEFYHHLFEEDFGSRIHEDEHESNRDDSDESNDDDDVEKFTLWNENKPLHPKLFSKSSKWPRLGAYLESFLKSTIHLLTEVGKQANLLSFVLKALAKYVPFLTAFNRISKAMLKTCVKLWSAPLDSSEEYQIVRLQAFLRIRQLAITQPYPFIEDCLKMTYLSYAQRSKFGTASNVTTVLPTLTFMGNCIVELYSLDYASSYQHAFVYIRQLALHLRTALMKKSKESLAVVYCWQYIHCVRLWVAVLSGTCGKSSNTESTLSSKLGGGIGKDEEANLMRSLVFPLTEIIMGVTRLLPIVRYVPLRLHCVRFLQQLAASTESFIPTTFLLLGILDLKEVRLKPLGENTKENSSSNRSTVRGLKLPLILKLPKEGALRTMQQLDDVLKEVFTLLNREVDLYRYSPGFPEFTFVLLQNLRKFNKEVHNGRWRAYSKATVELCQKYSAFIVQERATLVDAPKDVRRLEALKPTNVPSMRERYDAAVAKEKRLEAVTYPLMPSTKKKNPNETLDQKVKKKNKRKSAEQGGDVESNDEGENEVFEEVEGQEKIKLKSKQTISPAAVVASNVEALKVEDEVEEGIIWSDSD